MISSRKAPSGLLVVNTDSLAFGSVSFDDFCVTVEYVLFDEAELLLELWADRNPEADPEPWELSASFPVPPVKLKPAPLPSLLAIVPSDSSFLLSLPRLTIGDVAFLLFLTSVHPFIFHQFSSRLN